MSKRQPARCSCCAGPWLGGPATADEKSETVAVWVARADIPIGTPITEPEKLFKRVRFLKGDEPWNVNELAEALDLPVRLVNELGAELEAGGVLRPVPGPILAYHPARVPRATRNPKANDRDFVLVNSISPPQLDLYAPGGYYDQAHGTLKFWPATPVGQIPTVRHEPTHGGAQ